MDLQIKVNSLTMPVFSLYEYTITAKVNAATIEQHDFEFEYFTTPNVISKNSVTISGSDTYVTFFLTPSANIAVNYDMEIAITMDSDYNLSPASTCSITSVSFASRTLSPAQPFSVSCSGTKATISVDNLKSKSTPS
jgi:hypothetical protein